MRKIISLFLILTMCVGLVACGSNIATSKPGYKEQKVTYKKLFEVTCVNDEIICEKDSIIKADDLVLTLNVKNISDSDRKFSSVSYFDVKQGDKPLYPASYKNKKGKLYSSYENKVIEDGDTMTIKYAWQLKDHDDDVVVNFINKKTGATVGKMKFKVKGRQTGENISYEKESKREYKDKLKIKKVKLKSCTVKVPKGWFVRSKTSNNVSLQKKTKNPDGVIKSISVNSFGVKVKNAKAEAKRRASFFSVNKKDVKEFTVDGKTCYGFNASDHQFEILGKSSKGYGFEISGTGIGYDEAKSIIDKSIEIK